MVEIMNRDKILENAESNEDRRARQIALMILKAGVDSVDPRSIIGNRFQSKGPILQIDGLALNLDSFQRILIVGGGKASGGMAEALERMIGDRITEGCVNVLRGTKSLFGTQRIRLIEAGHPIPDKDGVRGARKIVELVRDAREDDLVFCLISGGGSALMPLPAADLTLKDKRVVTDALLKSGASIGEVNAVRKHISEIKGGRLAQMAHPATVISLIISDVVGDPLGSIASGPTAPDPTTFEGATEVLRRYDLWGRTPSSVRRRLLAGVRGEVPETPKPGDKVFEKVHNFIVGNNRLAMLSAGMEAKNLGLNTLLLPSSMEGEARHIGTAYGGIVRDVLESDHPVPRPAVIIGGGETTVTVRGKGLGGRNQELVLGAALKIGGLRGTAIASIGTDGLDWVTDAAGAIADGQSIGRARNQGLDPREALSDNNSYHFFSTLGDLILTGSTGTNVGDLTVSVIV
ncbi:MAG: glycerate kinase [Candidatus Bathyarchaeia archaeon]